MLQLPFSFYFILFSQFDKGNQQAEFWLCALRHFARLFASLILFGLGAKKG
jgi:hypothetical protein